MLLSSREGSYTNIIIFRRTNHNNHNNRSSRNNRTNHHHHHHQANAHVCNGYVEYTPQWIGWQCWVGSTVVGKRE